MRWCRWAVAERLQIHQAPGRIHQGRTTVRNQAATFIIDLKLTVYRSLKRELVRAQEEIKRIQSVPLVIGQFMEAIDQKLERHLNRSRTLLTKIAPASCNHPQDLTMLYESSLPSTARNSSRHPQSPSTATQIPLSISSPPKPIPPLLCLVKMKNQMSRMQMLVDLICRSKKSVKRSSYRSRTSICQ